MRKFQPSVWIVLVLFLAMMAGCQQAVESEPDVIGEFEDVPEPSAVMTEMVDTASTAGLPEGVDITPGLGKSYYDQVYCQIGGVPLIFDLHYPTSSEGPYPLVIYVHGGTWQMGDRRGGAGVAFTDALLDAGYAFAGVNYRLAPEYTFPAMIEDVKCAIRFFRTNADLLDLDSDRFAALGGSAGGHLVSLLGLTADQGFWESSGPNQGVSSSVAAVVDLFGPTDLRPIAEPVYQDSYLGVFGDAVYDEDAMWAISPLAYVHPDAPPFLIMHGDADQTVFLHHSVNLAEALETEGVPVELIIVSGGGHSSALFQSGASPDLDSLTESLLDFLGKYLN